MSNVRESILKQIDELGRHINSANESLAYYMKQRAANQAEIDRIEQLCKDRQELIAHLRSTLPPEPRKWQVGDDFHWDQSPGVITGIDDVHTYVKMESGSVAMLVSSEFDRIATKGI